MSFPMDQSTSPTDQSSSSTLESSPPVLAVEPSKYLSKLAAKRILVLGGTSGIGFAIAEAAVKHNAIVIISSSNMFKVEKALHRLQTAYPTRAFALSGMACNLADTATLESEIVDILGFATGYKQALLDHIAFTGTGGLIKVCPIAKASVEYMHSACVVRLLAPMVLAKHAPAYLRPGPDSSITFTGEGDAQKPASGWGIPAAYGACLEGLTRGMAQDLKPTRVNLISPGAVCTDEFSRVASSENGQALLESSRVETLTGRLGRPEDLADAYLHCMKNGFLTGTVIVVDGGRLIN